MKSIYKRYHLTPTMLLLLVIGLYSCKKFVQIDLPITKLATESVFADAAAATTAQMGIYQKMFSNSESPGLSQQCGMLSDELDNTSSSITNIQLYTNNILASNGVNKWKNSYSYIYSSNSIIENLENNNKIAPAVTRQLIGESKFIRAFWHFYLTIEYGDAPIVLTTNYQTNAVISRSPQAQVYQQIISDLTDALNLLNTNYVDVTDTVTTTERVRPNKAAAQALLARVFLYTKKYTDAEAMATNVINNSLYGLCANLSGTNSVFLKNSNEAIWQLQTPLPSSTATNDGLQYILISAPSTGTSKCNTISTALYNSFEAGDKRKTNWVGTYTTTTTPNISYHYPYKYQINTLSSLATALSSIGEYTMVLRLAEQYLIRAEARVYNGNTPGALSDLNMIRNRAGLANYSGATDNVSLLAAILHERQVELFTEWGHRWFDLIRTNNLNAVMGSPGNVYTAKGGLGSWDPTKQLFPVPSSEINSDRNLTQNPGYY